MFESCNNVISREILEQYIDLTPSLDSKQLKVKVSQVSLNLTPGSDDSLEFLDNVDKALPEAFYTPFVNYIDYKWDREHVFQYPIAFMNMYFALNLDFFALEFKSEPRAAESKLQWLAGVALLLQLFELVQMWAEGLSEYLASGANLFDSIGYVIFLCYAYRTSGDSMYNSNMHRDYLAFCLFFTNFRFIFHLSILYAPLRAMLIIIAKAGAELVSFLVVLYGFTMIMALCSYILVTEYETGADFLSTLYGSYTVAFGENADWDDIKSSYPKILLYLLSTNFIIIICMNILISIVTENYDNVQAKIRAYDA